MTDIEKLGHIIHTQSAPAGSIGIMSHIEPDGDGFCACLALHKYFRIMGIQSEIVVDEGNLERFEFVMEGAKLRTYYPGLAYELLIVLDCNSYSRLGTRAELVGKAGYTIVIDHHVPENGAIKAEYTYVDIAAASVGAIIYNALKDDIQQLPESDMVQISNCLYVTLLNDTNNFTNANTNAEVFQIAKGLCEFGISASELYKAYFLNHKPLEMRYIGEVLSTIELLEDGRILYMESTLEMQRRNKLSAASIMNITRWVQGVKDVDVIVYFREEAEDVYKLSLRSPNLNVNTIATKFGGGGHRSASGATIHGDLPSLKTEVLALLRNALN